MGITKFLVGVALLVVDHLRGPRIVTEVKQPDHAMGGLKAFTLRGYDITVHCQRKEYHVSYARWYIPDQIIFTYKVFSLASSNAPATLRRACELEIELPALVHRWSFEQDIKRSQINAYLDLLEKRLCKECPSDLPS